MNTIVIENLYNKVAHTKKAEGGTVIEVLHANKIDWMHACGAKGRCTTCKMVVIEGAENLGELAPPEVKFLEKKQLYDNERLACQCYAKGDIVIRVPNVNKLPHLKYSD